MGKTLLMLMLLRKGMAFCLLIWFFLFYFFCLFEIAGKFG